MNRNQGTTPDNGLREDGQRLLMLRAAWMYHMHGLNQSEVAGALQIPRIKVQRLLARARREGVVTVEVHGAEEICFELEAQLKGRFGLKDVLVVPTAPGAQTNRDALGRAAAGYLERTIRPNSAFASGWGYVLYDVARNLRPNQKKNVILYQLIGGLNKVPGTDSRNPSGILNLMSDRLGGDAFLLNTPAIVSSPQMKQSLLSEPATREIFDKARKAHVALVGVGDMTQQSVVESTGIFDEESMQEFRRAGAVGDILAQHFDLNGNLVDHVANDRIVALSVEELRKIETVVGVAAGPERVLPLIGAMRGGFINVVITDEATTREVLAAVDEYGAGESGVSSQRGK